MALEQRTDIGLRELALFAGCGGGILGGKLLGWRTVCAVEINSFCARRLMQRQNEGHIPSFPIWDNVSSFAGRDWRGIVDVVSGGFPCQDISIAGKGQGLKGERSGLWLQFRRVVREVEPRFVFVENSPMLAIRGLGSILRDLAALGYDARWGVFSCRDTGGVHLRKRLFIRASNRAEIGCGRRSKKSLPRFSGFPWQQDVRGVEDLRNRPSLLAPGLCRKRNDVADYVERVSAIGNGQIPRVVKLAWETLTSDFL